MNEFALYAGLPKAIRAALTLAMTSSGAYTREKYWGLVASYAAGQQAKAGQDIQRLKVRAK
jgi:hypothetical protein